MPNWTTNFLSFEAPKQKIIDLKKLFATKERVFDFNKILPMPEHSDTFYAEGSLGEEEREKFGENNWYHWSSKNWGTKWNAVDSNLDIDKENKILYAFRTAWDAPRGVMREIVNKRDTYIAGCSHIKWSCFHEGEEEEEIILMFIPK